MEMVGNDMSLMEIVLFMYVTERWGILKTTM
jgi:hypothetical protein